MIGGPFLDKRGAEKVLVYASGKGKEWDAAKSDGDIPADWLPSGWEGEVGAEEGWLKDYLVLRPCPFFAKRKEQGKYQVGEKLKGTWASSRDDVSHFILERALKEWDTWKGRRLNMG
jgi:hypothetical protein